MKRTKTLGNIIKREILLFEAIRNISDNEIKIDRGTTLFHGTGEEFNSQNIRPGGYDNIFWTTDNSAIAQTYIPTSSYLYINTKSISEPSNDKMTQNIQKALGIDFDYSRIEFINNRTSSYPTPKLYQQLTKTSDELNDRAFKLYQELKKTEQEIYDTSKEHYKISPELKEKYKQISVEYEKINKLSHQNRRERVIHDYINKQLIDKFGYKPTSSDDYNNSYSWKLKVDGWELAPADYSHQGRLLILTPKRDLRILDTTNRGRREGDLTDLDYHKHDWFEKAEAQGYDGIKINDFAQSNDQGNFGHVSYGLFKSTLKDLDVKETPAIHQDLDKFYRAGDWETPEYKKYKGGVEN